MNIFDQSIDILLVLYAIHFPQTDAQLHLCLQCPQAQVGRCNSGTEFLLENFSAVQSKRVLCNKTRHCTKELLSPTVVQYFIKSATLLSSSCTDQSVNPSCITSLEAFLETFSVRKPMEMKLYFCTICYLRIQLVLFKTIGLY